MTDGIKDGGAAFPVCPGQEGPITDRFLRYVRVGAWLPSSCWLWTGGKSAGGYGVFALTHRQQIRAHRYAYQIYTGRKPKGLVLHKCDNRACVNPLHLEDGTHKENMRQMAERKRATREEGHHKAKLLWQEAAAIYLMHKSGKYTTAELGEIFNVCKATATAIAARKLWPDVVALADAMLTERNKGGQ